MSIKLFNVALFSGVSLLAAVPAFAQDASAQPAAAAADEAADAEIVVTARRRDERLQDVPVSVTAFSAAALEQRSVQELADIGKITPGLSFTADGGKNGVNVLLRGIGVIPLGEGNPGVVTYINNVSIPGQGSSVPTYDVESIQVLKGPQGTLFGKNTLGGAVLITTAAPTDKLEGYVEGTYGSFDYWELEGAVNLPIVEDKAALRVAGQLRRQDPRTASLDGGPGFDNIKQDSFRVSLKLTPFEGFENTTVFDYFRAAEYAGGLYLMRQNFPFSLLFTPAVGPELGSLFGDALDAQIQGYLAQQHANPHASFDDGINGGNAHRLQKAITNTTQLELNDNLKLRNIFGFRTSLSEQAINTGAVGALSLPTSLLSTPEVTLPDTPFTLFHAADRLDRQYLSNEFQILGDYDSFNFILGAYYNEDKPHGVSGSNFVAFHQGPITGTDAITSHVTNKNKALFGQIGYKITEQLTLNAGLRYSWDKVSACGGDVGGVYVSDAACRAVAALGNTTDGVGTIDAKGNAPSWTIGLDYKPSNDLLLYVVSRRGYRGVNVNTPLFETVYTTGGTDATCGLYPGLTPGQCPDLRPFQTTKPETLTDIEFGEKLSTRIAGARVVLNTAVFYSKYKNSLQFINVVPTGIPQGAPDYPSKQSFGANAADLSIYGVELEASVSPVRSFTVTFNGAYTHSKVDKITLPAGLQGANLTAAGITLYSPKFSGTVAASWTLPCNPLDGDLIVNADLFYSDAFGGQGGENLPGYELANARLDWKGIAGTGVDLGLYVRNLFNAKYLTATSVLIPSFPVSSAYLGAPRTWGISGRFSF